MTLITSSGVKSPFGNFTIFRLSIARARSPILKMVRSQLLHQGLISAVGAEMGKIFQSATLCCITGGVSLGLKPLDDVTLPSVGAKVSRAYWEKVVRQLEEIRV